MKATYENKAGVLDVRQYLGSWIWSFSPDVCDDPDYDTEVLQGTVCQSKDECKAQWEMLGVIPA